ncbi:hypothetical protein [Mycoplasmoides pirum]|uniref:hypothetical protein n=1 Tax=Mycoplasmoides pirum TaxID=2122 RepID=UPI00047F88DD|nr:hypothetical protein [Mycoplasmoides pirum]
MNKFDNWNRFGDTSFRISNQVNFYTQIFTYILEKLKAKNSKNYKLYISDVLEYVIQEQIVFYKIENKDFTRKNRSHLLVRQLKEFNLILIKNDNSIQLTNFGTQIGKILEDNKIASNLIPIIWFFLMLHKDSKRSNIFKGFVKNCLEIGYSDKLLISFITSKNKFDINSKLEKNKLSKEDIAKILKEKDIQVVCKRKKPLKISKILPQLINAILEKNFLLINNLLDDVGSKLKNFLKKMYKLWNNEFTNKKITDNQIQKYILSRKENLLNDILNLVDYQTVYKDYKDINIRWLVDTLFLIKLNDKYVLNNKYINIYKNLIELDPNDFDKFYSFLTNLKLPTNFYEKLPYNRNEVIKMLELVNDNKWNELKKNFNLTNISNSTIFEYLINLSFSISYNNNASIFKEWCNTKLDNNLKPIIHASSGSPDGIIIDNSYFSTVESTLINDLEKLIKQERIPIKRHVYNIYKNKKHFNLLKFNNNPTVVFVVKEKLTPQLIYQFVSEHNSQYHIDLTKISIITLSTFEVLTFLKDKNLQDLLVKMKDELPMKSISIDAPDDNKKQLDDFFNLYMNKLMKK